MKTYFIGLGGCGLKTVAAISRRLKRENLHDFNEDYAFTYIDTDENTFNDINPEGDLSPNDFKDLGDTVPLATYNRAIEHPDDNNEKRFLEWVISQEPGHMVLPNYPLKDGATAQRNVGRCAIYHNYAYIENELNRKLQRFSRNEQMEDRKRDVDVWVVASSCGGTGSSMILDVLHMINRLGYPIANGEPNVKLVLFMPHTFVELNKENKNHKLNAFSCLEEINCFRSNFENGNGKTFDAFAVRPNKEGDIPIDFPLFRYLIPVCSETNVGTSMTDKQLYPTVAEMIYYLNTGKGASDRKSDLSNQIVEAMQLSARNKGITSQMMGYGFRAIKKANNELKEYLEKRALYEVVKYGLLDNACMPNFDEVMREFANDTILSNLMTLNSPKVRDTENNIINDFIIDLYNQSESLESKVKKYIDNAIKYDPDNIDSDAIKSISNKLDKMLGEDFDEIKCDIYDYIKEGIDGKLNEIILKYGLEHAYNIINTLDDSYLEPLGRHIKNTLLPDVNEKLKVACSACKTYEKEVRRRDRATAAQSVKNYKEAVTKSVTLNLTKGIIENLTTKPYGYLEQLRNGYNKEVVGIKKLIKALGNYKDDFENDYRNLSKTFRETARNAMTIYLPSLVEIATGTNGGDWSEDNTFDQLYQTSILEQREITSGLEHIKVPVRISNNNSSRGLKNILERIGEDDKVNNVNIFVDIIKGKEGYLSTTIEDKIIAPLKRVVLDLAMSTNTAAGEWIGRPLSEIVNEREYIPKAFDNKPAKFFNSFKAVDRIPVFFPLRPGENMPANNKLMFVGADREGALAKSLGYDGNDKGGQKFVEDKSMVDRFVVIRMPIGLNFTMYKYYPNYRTEYFSEETNKGVRGLSYGCHIHQAFNEYGSNLFQLTCGGNVGNKGVSDQLSESRVSELVRCLFYQHVVNIMYEKDKLSYNKLFGFNTTDVRIDESNMTPEMRAFLGLPDEPSVSVNTQPEQFITIDLDMTKHHVKLCMRPVVDNPQTKYLEVISKSSKIFELDKNHFDKCTAFVEQLLTIPSEFFSVANIMAGRFDNSRDQNLHNALEAVKTEAKQRLMNPGDSNIKFALCLMFWKRYSKDKKDANLVKIIEDVINSL